MPRTLFISITLFFVTASSLSAQDYSFLEVKGNNVKVDSAVVLSLIQKNPTHARSTILTELNNLGFFDAVLSLNDENDMKFMMDVGCRYRINNIILQQSSQSQDSLEIDSYFSKNEVNKVLEKYLSKSTSKGYLDAQISINDLIIDRSNCSVNIQTELEKGKQYTIEDLDFSGLESYSEQYVRRIISAPSETTLSTSSLKAIRRQLEETGFFQNISEPMLMKNDSVSVVQLHVEERNLSSFDGLIGYAPDADGNNILVGDLELTLYNSFLSGNDLDFRFQRIRKGVSELDLSFQQHWIYTLPVSIGGTINFFQNDTTYQSRSLEFNIRYPVNEKYRWVLKGGFQNSIPGNNVPVILEPEGSVSYYGVGFQYSGLPAYRLIDSGINWYLNLNLRNKKITQDTLLTDQQILITSGIEGRLGLKGASQLSTRIESYLLYGDLLTFNDLNRIGGAKSLRGFAEQQFAADKIIWGELEYRFFTDPFSYLFGFVAGGLFTRGLLYSTESRSEALSERLLSGGFGLSYATRIGRITFSYALSKDTTPTNGKVHLGIKTNL